VARKDADPTLTRRQTENAKAAIQVGTLVSRLQKNANGEIEMTTGQIKSAEILLRKRMPDQQHLETESTSEPMPLSEIREQLIEMMVAEPELLKIAQARLNEKNKEETKANLSVVD